MNLLEIVLDETSLLNRPLADGTTLGDAMQHLAAAHKDPHAALMKHHGEWPIGWLDLPAGGGWLDKTEDVASRLAGSCESLIVCGIGGSALGAQAVYRALDQPGWRLKKVHVLDNVDPTQVSLLLDELDLRTCAINVISKSGETLETMAGFFYLLEQLDRHGFSKDEIAARIVATTDEQRGLLRPYAKECGWETLVVPGDVGGRFSVFTPVGLLPLAYAGVELHRLLDGARQMQEYCISQPPLANPAWQLAALHYLLHTGSAMNIAVQYIYGDCLVLLGDWWRQLWAESLAKAVHVDDSVSGAGQTPLVARGATDQHSQNQLYFDGPDDKLYGMLTSKVWPTDEAIRLPSCSTLDDLSYLDGHTFGDILEASRKGVRDALRAAGRPVYEIILGSVNESAIGAFLQLWMLATAYAGQLYNVNPFDQPGVEKSKIITKQRLNAGI